MEKSSSSGSPAAVAAAEPNIGSVMLRISEESIFPIVETSNGRVRGLTSGGIHSFKGVRYGASTAGRNRYMPPQPPGKWAGVVDATAYGNYAPQFPNNRLRVYADLIMYDIQPGGMGEDCLVINLWTPRIDRTAKLPVLVHLHGGGYYGGSGNSPQFDGEMLARFGAAVVISVNHRLGSFGFLNLSGFADGRYAESGAAGMLDIVAALDWVKVNIENFGGDPNRVLVFGQSGGGAKTSILLAMPSAKGLFHRAGIMSGSVLRVATKEESHVAAEKFLHLLELGPGSVDVLHRLPMERLLAAQVSMEMADREKGEAPRPFCPAVDGTAIPRQPFDPDAPDVSIDVPLIVGTTLDERSYRLVNFDLTDDGLQSFVHAHAMEDPSGVLKMYRDEDPHGTPYLLQARMESDMTFRKSAHELLKRSVSKARAPVYSYLWRVPSPAFASRYGATHGSDLGPSMYDIRSGLNGPSIQNVEMARQIASAWISFAGSGDPNNARTPDWPTYTLSHRSTMVFQNEGGGSAAQDDPRKWFREYWSRH